MNSMVPRVARALLPVIALAAQATPASARVAEVSERGFVIRHVAEVPATPDEVWSVLLKPADWWDSAHTWSGRAASLTIDPRAGGCFCEVLPNAASARAAPRGSVEHMRVVYIEQPRALRMTGLLGPLQGDAAVGTMTVQLRPAGEGSGKTQIMLEYVVGGYLRTPADKIAPAVDGVLGAQLGRLAGKFGGAFAEAFLVPDAAAAPEAAAGVVPAAPEPPVAATPGLPAAPPASAALPDVLPLADTPPAGSGKKKPAGR